MRNSRIRPRAGPRPNDNTKRAIQENGATNGEIARSAPPAEEPKPEPPKESGEKGKDKEERFDMTEVAPVVTHHEITMNGKLLHYTATTGRLPIKRADGKIEAQMFFVAYTWLDRAPVSVP